MVLADLIPETSSGQLEAIHLLIPICYIILSISTVQMSLCSNIGLPPTKLAIHWGRISHSFVAGFRACSDPFHYLMGGLIAAVIKVQEDAKVHLI